jgi:hypothetical protein
VARTQTKKAAKSIAKFQEGAVIGKRLKAADYEEVVAALLVRTMFDYEGLVSTHDAFLVMCRLGLKALSRPEPALES